MKLTYIFNKLRHGAAQLRITHYALCIGLALTTSCADMLQHDDDMTMTPEQNKLNTPYDTIYNVTGVIKLLQNVADRTNLLGELRGDLTQCTADAALPLKNLAQFEFDNLGKYNNPADYYAIINSCNYYINKVDTAYSKRGQEVFTKEYAVMKTYRAWAYLQLINIYGNVPFYTHFVSTNGQGEDVINAPWTPTQQIYDYLISDLAPHVDTPFPNYGSIGGYSSREFFIPVRLMLGELCLNAGRYYEAAQYYHDFLTNRNKPLHMLQSDAVWSWQYTARDRKLILNRPSQSYTAGCSPSSSECIAFIPMEEAEVDGTVSYLDDIYESTEDNKGYYQATYSEALAQLSASQNYCVYVPATRPEDRDTVIVKPGDTIFAEKLWYGDLRLNSNVDRREVNSATSSEMSKFRQTMTGKIYTTGRCLYRRTQVYLHYAEALNLAGFPSAALMILKYGVCPEYVEKYVTPYERERSGTLLTFNTTDFPELIEGTDRAATYPIHSRGCGDAHCDTLYTLPMPAEPLPSMADTIAFWQPYMDNMIIDEAALECAFEGTRFHDLVRVALRRNEPEYLADRVARRSGTLDEALRTKLMDKKNWYLPLNR